MTAGVRFRSHDAALIRLTPHAHGGELPPWPDLTGETTAYVPGWREWLQQVWADEAIVEAIELASPHLVRRVDAVCAGHVFRPRRVRRAVESVVRYLLRMHSRATPFGLFVGVAPMRIGAHTGVRTQAPGSAVARPDSAWLAAVVAELEARPEVLRCLTVVANNLGFARADRWVLPWQQQPSDSDQVRIGEVSIRHTHPVRFALRAARSPVAVADLTDKLAAELPDASREQIERMLATLVAQRVLITDVPPPMEATDPLDHVIERLAATAPGGDHADALSRLQTVRAHLVQYGRASTPRQRRALREAATDQMTAMRAQPEPQLAVDLRVGEAVELPPAVAREAESAAAALVALNPHRSGNPAWSDYHGRFLERYGSGAVVPLTEVTDTESGIGFPAGYRDSPTALPPPAASERDRRLLRLAQQAALGQHREVVLDDRSLHELASETVGDASDVVPHTELRFLLHATSAQKLDQGQFTLSVAGAARQAGTLTGRFLHLLDDPDRERMTRELAHLPGLTPGSRLAQISSPPLAARTHNVARAPAVFPRIPLGAHHTDGSEHIALEDLAVVADDRRLSLVSLSQGCVVEPVMFNAVELRHASQPLARFLCEITTARAASCKPFEWGTAEALPFLPRLRYRRTVLAPARWSVAAVDLPSSDAPWPQWEHAWSRLRHRMGLPGAVFVGEDDRRLRLDLDEPAHQVLLRRHLDQAGHAELIEAPDPGENGWIGGRAHEIVLPMATAHPATATAAPRSRSTRPTRHPGHTPGDSPWLYARLHAQPDRHEDILTTHLPRLLENWCEGPPGAWWFLRYREPDPHLRLRLRLHDASHYGAAVQRLGAWATHLRTLGLLRTLVLDTYYPEVGRYGVGAVMQAAEDVFAADSAAVLTQLAASTRGSARRRAVTAASFVDLAASFTGNHERGMEWLVAHPSPRPEVDPLREARAETLRLADPAHGPAALQALPAGPPMLQEWEHRRSALATYRNRLEESGGPDNDQVLASLLHLHHVRIADIDPEGERACLRLARAAALSWQARREGSTPSPL
ncbi:lantibiotic dehydratase [Streptomonospora algeriensis]|uniref:Lantibiotic dehydratase n=1 Tax=Streptomonospora algeriensis TaxID=995084 RepID=A0ABW3BA93_9ACTN